MKLKPLHNRIHVERIHPRATAGGVVIPDNVKRHDTYCLGRVLAMGAGIQMEDGSVSPMPLEVGDVVIYSEYAGTRVIDEDSNEEKILQAGDIWAVVDGYSHG